MIVSTDWSASARERANNSATKDVSDFMFSSFVSRVSTVPDSSSSLCLVVASWLDSSCLCRPGRVPIPVVPPRAPYLEPRGPAPHTSSGVGRCGPLLSRDACFEGFENERAQASRKLRAFGTNEYPSMPFLLEKPPCGCTLS